MTCFVRGDGKFLTPNGSVSNCCRSYKIASYKQIHKYTVENIRYYEEYLKAVIFLPLCRLKFIDEVSFKKKGSVPICQVTITYQYILDVRRLRGRSKVGQPVIMNERSSLNEPTLSAIVLTW